VNRALGMLGLCARAGKIQSGEQAVELALKKGQACLILLDGAASQGTRKALSDACTYYSIPMRLTDADALGEAIGKPGRKVAAVTDGKLAQKLAGMLPGPENEDPQAALHND